MGSYLTLYFGNQYTLFWMKELNVSSILEENIGGFWVREKVLKIQKVSLKRD